MISKEERYSIEKEIATKMLKELIDPKWLSKFFTNVPLEELQSIWDDFNRKALSQEWYERHKDEPWVQDVVKESERKSIIEMTTNLLNSGDFTEQQILKIVKGLTKEMLEEVKVELNNKSKE